MEHILSKVAVSKAALNSEVLNYRHFEFTFCNKNKSFLFYSKLSNIAVENLIENTVFRVSFKESKIVYENNKDIYL